MENKKKRLDVKVACLQMDIKHIEFLLRREQILSVFLPTGLR